MVSGSTARISRAERKAQTREGLLDAAMRLFCERGFHATSLDLVAAEAGYTKGAVYSNFASKEDLFFALYERRVEQEATRLREVLKGSTPAEVAEAVVARRRGGTDDGWLAVFFEFWAHVLRNPALRERFERLHRQGRAPMLEATQRMFKRKPGVDAESFNLAATAMVTGLSLEQLTDPSLDAGAVTARMLEMLIKGARA
jgi:AcrR family transcriptional regulator